MTLANALDQIKEAAGDGYVYLASPYSHLLPNVMQERHDAAAKAAAALMRAGVPVFAPIPHSHAIALQHGLPTDWGFWAAQDIPLVRAAACVVVLALPGYDRSTGVRAECDFAGAQGMEIIVVDP